MLTVEHLRVLHGGAEACRDVSLTVRAGEVVALLGANGAGKTTTLRTISGLHRSTSGSVSFRGQALGSRPPHAVSQLGIAHVPEGRRLFARMTVRENLEIGLYRRGSMRTADVGPAFALFPELEPLERRLAYSLSGGQQQMVALARALLPDPDLVMLDEPSLGLAPIVVDRIMETIERLRERGKGVLLVEQDTNVAVACCDRGYVLANGSIVFAGTQADLRDSATVTEAYLGRLVDDCDPSRPGTTRRGSA